jgi:hypothetical protein
MTVETLDELVERIHKALVHDAYDTNDITNVLNRVLQQRDRITELVADNHRLTDALAIAGRHIEQLEAAEPLTHLVQYAEGSN